MQRSSAVPVASALLCAWILGVTGCGGDETANAIPASISSGQTTAGASSPQAAVVQQFIQAVQKGDRASAKNLLTAKTIANMDAGNVEFLPQALTDGKFRIGKTVKSGNNYFVQCVYSVDEADGTSSSQHLQWMVKQENGEKWAIFGMVVHISNEEPTLVNFEQDLLAPDASTESPPTTQNPPQQAAAPQDPFQVSPR
jgi:hypothetical protein